MRVHREAVVREFRSVVAVVVGRPSRRLFDARGRLRSDAEPVALGWASAGVRPVDAAAWLAGEYRVAPGESLVPPPAFRSPVRPRLRGVPASRS